MAHILRWSITLEVDPLKALLTMTALTQEQFALHLTTSFRLAEADRETQLELIEVSELKRTAGQERFSLIFRGPLESFIPQGCYDVRHDQMGEFPLFIVPIRQDSEGFYYEAVFNRLTEQTATP